MDVSKLAADLSPWGLVCIFAVWTWRRECRMAKRLDQITDQMSALQTRTLVQVSSALETHADAHRVLAAKISGLPCVRPVGVVLICVLCLSLAGCLAYGARDARGGDSVSRGLDSAAAVSESAAASLPGPLGLIAGIVGLGLGAAAEVRRRMLDRDAVGVIRSLDKAKTAYPAEALPGREFTPAIILDKVIQTDRQKALVDRAQGKPRKKRR
jgi:hypothetical protein